MAVRRRLSTARTRPSTARTLGILVLAGAAVGAILTEPREYPIAAFLLLPLASAIFFSTTATAALAALAVVAAASLAITGDEYEGLALVFRLAFLVVAAGVIVVLAAAREHRERFLAGREALRAARASLLRSERRYRSLVETATALVWTWDADGNVTEPQAAWEHSTGQAWTQQRGTGWIEAFHPDDRDAARLAIASAIDTCRSGILRARLWNTPLDEYRHVMVRYAPVVEENGEVREWIAAVTDVHDQTLAQLRAGQDARFRAAVFESLQDGVFVSDGNGYILDVNDAWTRICGYTREESLAARLPYPWWPDPDVHPTERAGFVGLAADVAERRDTGEYELSFRHRDGHLVPTLTTVSIVRDEHARIRLIVATVKDVSEQVAAQHRLRLVADLGARLASADGSRGVAEAAVDVLVAGLDAAAGALYVLDADSHRLQVRAARGFGEGAAREWAILRPEDAVPASDAFSRRAILICTDAEHRARYPLVADAIARAGLRTTLHLPLTHQRDAIGVLSFGFAAPRCLSNEDEQLLAAVAPLIAQALDRARLFEFQRSVAATLQQAMLAPAPAASAELAIAARYLPAVTELEVGGDWYDVVPLGDRRVAIAVGDIVGRGLHAAAVMGQLRSALNALARTTDSTAEAVSRLDLFAQPIEGARAATLVYCIVDPDAGTVRYTTAGHPPPLVVAPDGRTSFLREAGSWPLAVADPGSARREAVARLAPGSTLVLYTDGLVERRGQDVDTGMRRLAAEAARRAELPVERLCDELLEVLVGDARRDDVAIVALRAAVVTAPVFTCRVPATPSEIANVRRMLSRWMQHRRLPARVQADLTLAVGEACTNAIEHVQRAAAHESVLVEAQHGDGEIVLTVHDPGIAPPFVPGRRREHAMNVIASVTDGFVVSTTPDGGTHVEMRRKLTGGVAPVG